eukprot:s6266_g3.t1
MQSLNPGHSLATTAWAHSAFNKKDRILLDAISKEVMQRLYEIEPQSLGILADAQLGCQPQLEQVLRPFAQRFADLMPRGLDDSTMTTFMQLVREIRVDNFGAWGTRHVFQQMGLASPTQDFLDRAQGEILKAGAAVGADEGDARQGVGIRSPEELSSSLSSLNELLQGAGFLKFSAETLQALREQLPQNDSSGAQCHRAGFGGPNPNSVFKHAQQKEAPLCEDNLWKDWKVVGTPVPEPIAPRACAMSSYAAELEEMDNEEDEDDEEDEDADSCLSDDELMTLCVAKKVPLLQLQSNKRAIQLLRQKLQHLRAACLSRNLPADESMRRPGLLQLLADQSWHSLGIPVEQLPSLVVAHGVLDSLGTLNTKNLADLCAQCHRTPV